MIRREAQSSVALAPFLESVSSGTSPGVSQTPASLSLLG